MLNDLMQLNEANRIRAWPTPEVVTGTPRDTIYEIGNHLGMVAGLTKDDEIWNRKSVSGFVSKQILRKNLYVFLLWISIVLIIFSFFSIAFGVIESDWRFQIFGLLSLFLGLGVLICRRRLGKVKFRVKVETFLSPELPVQQKQIITAEIARLLQSGDDIYLKVNYNEYRRYPGWILSAENSFLLFTDEVADQRGVILRARPPFGLIYVKLNRVKKEGEIPPQDELLKDISDNSVDQPEDITVEHQDDHDGGTKTHEEKSQDNILKPEIVDNLEPEKAYLYQEYGLKKYNHACLHLRVINKRKKFLDELVKIATGLQDSGNFKSAFDYKIRAYRHAADNHQNWKSLMRGNVEFKLKEKLRQELCPDNPKGKEAEARLNEFLKPGNRNFNEYVAELIDIPTDLIDEQARLFIENK